MCRGAMQPIKPFTCRGLCQRPTVAPSDRGNPTWRRRRPVMGKQRFEVDGADPAAEFLKGKGVPKESVEVVWDAVALHTSRGIVERKRPEIALVSAGAGADVAGFGIDQLPKEAVAQVIAAFPRPGFKKAYQKVMTEIVVRKRGMATGNFLAGIGERHVPGYKVPNVCDLMDAAPFAD